MLTDKDLLQIERNNLCATRINDQLQTFIHGIPHANVIEPASINNGILIISEEEKQLLVTVFTKASENLEVTKFVPASGAASRMFKFLHHFIDTFSAKKHSLTEFLLLDANADLKIFHDSYKSFAFSSEILRLLSKEDFKFNLLSAEQQFCSFVKLMLSKSGLSYGNLPKGLIPFHQYQTHTATAFEEQLMEAVLYARNGGLANVHFTVSEAHKFKFEKEFQLIKERIQATTQTGFNISYSFQKKETNTIAVTLNNEPFRNETGEIVFRPAGHGALIENLNLIDADIIFIKNIDNVVCTSASQVNSEYKRMLGGKLLEVQAQIFSYLELMENSQNNSDTILLEIKKFCAVTLNQHDVALSSEALINVLNRPLRVCGVVPNTGAPGGGPFWVKDKNGSKSLQIVEMSQINLEDEIVQEIVNSATHFNPVDLVCGTRNYKGKKFNLLDFVNPNAGFISTKSENGKQLKALELPGLWNGAMAKWNTIFVEVPIETFNPVKTVNDLLQPQHQPKI